MTHRVSGVDDDVDSEVARPISAIVLERRVYESLVQV